jgi:hypothetical protein
MKCLKKEKIRKEGKLHHIMNERLVLEAVGQQHKLARVECPFIIQMHYAFQTVAHSISSDLIIETLPVHNP